MDNVATEWEIEMVPAKQAFRIKVSKNGLGSNLSAFAGSDLRVSWHNWQSKTVESDGDIVYYAYLYLGQTNLPKEVKGPGLQDLQNGIKWELPECYTYEDGKTFWNCDSSDLNLWILHTR